jgi:hypothetical protein
MQATSSKTTKNPVLAAALAVSVGATVLFVPWNKPDPNPLSGQLARVFVGYDWIWGRPEPNAQPWFAAILFEWAGIAVVGSLLGRARQ